MSVSNAFDEFNSSSSSPTLSPPRRSSSSSSFFNGLSGTSDPSPKITVHPSVAPSVGTSGGSGKSTQHQYGAGEKFDLGQFALSALNNVMALPGQILEAPVSIADQVTKGVFGTPISKAAADFFDKTPVGDLARGAQHLLDLGWDAPGALLNAPTARFLADTSHLPDNTPWIHAVQHQGGLFGDFQNFLQGLPGVGLFFGGGQPGAKFDTLGQYRSDAQQRGIGPNEIQAVQNGTRDIWSFGKNAISNNPWEDLAARFALDPTNLALMGAGKVVEAPRLLNAAFKAAGIGTKVAPAGIELASGLEKAGVWSSRAVDAATSAEAIAAGDVSKATWKGVGAFLKTASRGYGKAALATYAGVQGTSFVLDNTPAGGFLEGLRSLAHDIENDHPLSENGVFNLIAAFNVPVRDFAGDVIGKAGQAKRQVLGVGAATDMARHIVPPGVKNAGAWLTDQLGGQEGVSLLVNHVAQKIVFQKYFPKYEAMVADIPTATQRFALLGDLVRRDAEKALASKKISGRELASQFKQWYGEQAGFSPERRTGVNVETGATRRQRSGLRFPWVQGLSEEKAVQAWQKYVSAVDPVSTVFRDQGNVVLGLTRVVTQENLADIGHWLTQKAVDGHVSQSDLHDVLLSYPGLAFNSTYWDGAALAKSTSLREIKGELKRMSESAPASAEIGHEVRMAEQQAPDPIQPHQGLVQADGTVQMQPAKMGEATVAFSRMRPDLGQQPSTLADVQSMRANATVRYAEDHIGQALERAGFNVERVSQAIGGWKGSAGPELEPSVKAVFSEAATADEMRVAASVAAKAFNQDASIWYATGDRIGAMGLKPNGVLLRFGGIDTTDLPRVVELAHKYFGGIGYTIDDATGELIIAAGDARTKRRALSAAQKMTKDLGADPIIEPAYSEYITNRGEAPNGQRADAILQQHANTDPRAGTVDAVTAAVSLPGGTGGVAGERGPLEGLLRATDQSGNGAGGQVPPTAGKLGDLYRRQWLDAGASPDTVDAVAALVEARAAKLGVSPDTLHQGVSVANAAEIPSGAELQAGKSGYGARPTREELAPLLEQQAPQALRDAGLGDSSPLEWTKGTDGRDIAIPGGLDGEFSLWDAWRLKSQQIDPNVLDPQTRVGLYAKLFRSQQRALENPVDTFNRVAFAIISPNLNLLDNEVGAAVLRARSLDDIRAIAEMPKDELVGRIKAAGSNPYPLQIETLQRNAQRFLENPEWFNMRPAEDLTQYSERVMSVLDGAGMKVGNFASMLGDPLEHNRGTIDSHMVELLIREGYVTDPAVVARHLKDGTGIAPSAKAVSLVKNGKPNPDVPPYLRDLPWVRKDGKVMVFAGDYKVFADALDAKLHKDYPGLPFHSGGGQWFLWDAERGIVEPHTTIWPGATQLEKLSTEQIYQARGVAKDAGYFAKSSEKRVPYDPFHALFFQSGDAGPRGFTVKSASDTVIGLTKASDPSTAVHELWHGILEPSLLPEERALLEQHGAVGEAGAQLFEKYLSTGTAPVAGLQKIFEGLKSVLARVYEGIKGSPLALKLKPEVRQAFDNLWADEISTQLDKIPGSHEPLTEGTPIRQAIDASAPGRVLYNAQADAEAQAVLGKVVFDPALKASFDGEVPAKLALLQHAVEQDYGGLYTLKPPPKLATLLDRSKDGFAKDTLLQHTTLGEWVYDRGPLAPITRFYDWLTHPVQNLELVRAAQQSLYNELIPLGANTKEVGQFIAALRAKADEGKILGFNIFRGPQGLLPDMIRKTASDKFSPKVMDAIAKRNDDIVRILDRSSNRFVRQAHQAAQQGNKLAAAVDFAYRGWQKSPLGEPSRIVSKTMYPIFRFILDPRWLMLNAVEADFIGGLKYGLDSTRINPAVRAAGTLDVGTATMNAGHRITEAHAKEIALDAEVNGGMLYQRHLAGYINEAFRTGRFKSTEELINSLPANHDWIGGMAQVLGEDQSQWAGKLDQMLYDWSTKGTKKTLQDETAKLLSAQDKAAMAPLLDKLYERHQQLYQDILQSFTGNHNRSNIERLLNSYWLYWPISYQIKATKWLFDVLTKQAGGKTTNLAGAWEFSHLYQEHTQRMQDDPSYNAMFTDHPTLWFVAQMLMPITPGDVGVTLSRPVRYAGSALGVWGAYKEASDPLTAASAILNLGPIYTTDLLQRAGKEIFHPKKAQNTAATFGATARPTPNQGAFAPAS